MAICHLVRGLRALFENIRGKMSRIHEALKKAAQERSLQVAAGSVDLADVAPRFESPLSNKMQMGESVVRALVFQKVRPSWILMTFCDVVLTRDWDLDPRMNIFLNTEEGRIGRERFRTLRSSCIKSRRRDPSSECS